MGIAEKAQELGVQRINFIDVFLLSALFVLIAFGAYKWRAWVVENDQRAVAEFERSACENDLHGTLVKHTCYLPNRRQR